TEKVTTGPDSVMTVRLIQKSDLRRATIGRFRVALSREEHSYPETGESIRKAKVKDRDPEASTLSIAADQGLPPEVLAALETDEPDRTDEQKLIVARHFQWAVPEFQEAYVQMARLEHERNQFEARFPRVLLTERIKPRVTRVLARGNFLDEKGPIVE